MFIKHHFLKPKSADVLVGGSRRAFYTFLIGSSVMLGVSGCGQKGDLYLVDSSSQTVQESTGRLNSTSNPQDAAFAGVDDDNYQKERYLEQQQILPEPSTDPNDY
ncbi:lipoprotein [Psychrobacter okhotskensis]|uniref:LPS translocon maturation chaperone LptM n=1 Tax=Psychrobacter okhotskensis TaxID=212403 RepID=UPI001563B72B|nr:lipoprotein [Psychrobacter okhotskensis]NRD69756.1 lipoprotein [Psychrobacter okhotskensis]